MKRIWKWLIIENEANDIINIKTINYIQKHGENSTYIRTNGGELYIYGIPPKEIFKIIRERETKE